MIHIAVAWEIQSTKLFVYTGPRLQQHFFWKSKQELTYPFALTKHDLAKARGILQGHARYNATRFWRQPPTLLIKYFTIL